jgi:hypothetical protein
MEINRRNFMKKATIAGLSTVAFTPAIADPVPNEKGNKKTSPAATDRIRTGFIGVGNRGQGHLKTCVGLTDVEIVAICDVSDRSLSAARKIISGSKLPEPHASLLFLFISLFFQYNNLIYSEV